MHVSANQFPFAEANSICRLPLLWTGGGKPVFRIPGLDRFRGSDDIETLPIETILRLRLGRMEEIRNHRHASS